MKRKYDELDARIMALLAKGSTTFAAIVAACASAAWVATRPDEPAWRTIQSRLQVLRKAGKIEHADGWWQIVDVDK